MRTKDPQLVEREKQEQSHGIIKSEQDGYKLYIKDDGFDYTALWDAFRKGQLESVNAFVNNPLRQVHLLEAWGRKFILKIDRKMPKYFEVKLWRAIHGPFYSRQMKDINRAINNGCTATADIYFVAEKMKGLLCVESYNIQEFIEGSPLASESDFTPFYPAIAAAVEDLHRNNLVFSDVHAFNIMLTKDKKIKLIDLSWSGMTWAGKGKDVVSLRKEYGIELPERHFLRWLASKYIEARQRIRHFGRGKS